MKLKAGSTWILLKLANPLYWILLKLIFPSALIFAILYGFITLNPLIWIGVTFLLLLLPFVDMVIFYFLAVFRPLGILFPFVDDDKHKLWLQIHAFFGLVSIFDVMLIVLTFASSYPLFRGNAQAVIGSVTLYGILYFLSMFWRYTFLNMLGMGYERFRGFSMLGVAAIARLITIMLSSKEKISLKYLSDSLKLLRELIKNRNAYLAPLEYSLIAVESMKEVGDNSHWEDLKLLSAALSRLPNLDGLPLAVKNFNSKVEWVLDFEPLEPRPSHGRFMERVGSLAAAVGGIATAFTLIPDPARVTLYFTFVSTGAFLSIPAVLMLGWALVLMGDLLKSPTFLHIRRLGKDQRA